MLEQPQPVAFQLSEVARDRVARIKYVKSDVAVARRTQQASDNADDSPPLDHYDSHVEEDAQPASNGKRPYLGASYEVLPLEETVAKLPEHAREFVEKRLRGKFIQARTFDPSELD